MNSTSIRRPVAATIAAAFGLSTFCLSTLGPSTINLPDAAAMSSTVPQDHRSRETGEVEHEYSVENNPVRGTIMTCGNLTLRARHGVEIETTEADLRDGVGRISISRIGRGLRFHGSDGRTYRASAVTAAWFVLHAPDFETPVHGLEVSQVMFRGGPDKSPGWFRETYKWTDRHETHRVSGPCNFPDNG